MSTASSTIESILVENRVFAPSEASAKNARISGMPAYDALCKAADADFEGFWAKLARESLVWTKPFAKTLNESDAPFYKWFEDGELNASANCLDKHIGTPVENKVAITFEAGSSKSAFRSAKVLQAVMGSNSASRWSTSGQLSLCRSTSSGKIFTSQVTLAPVSSSALS